MINLEWLRHHLQCKSDQVNTLQVKWLENEEKRRKRLYEDCNPSNVNPLTKEPKKQRTESKTVEAHDVEKEILTSSTTGSSKKQVRESENEFSIGGMRNPAAAVSRLAQVHWVGEQIHTAWLSFVHNTPRR